MTDEQVEKVNALLQRVAPLFHGQSPDIVGAVLSDLVALLLAGHQGVGAEELREELLQLHIETVRILIPVNEVLLFGEQGTVQ
jgi:hypothetical protein